MDTKPSFWRTLVRERHVPSITKLETIFNSLSLTEKTLFLACLVIALITTLSLVGRVSAEFSVNVPRDGGSLIEGIVGTPRFINPLLSISDADRDLTALVYSGLLKARPDGTFIPDLASSYTISKDGLTYSFTLRPDATFHDGTPVTVEDVKFTIEKAKESALKSPRRVNWEGVTVDTTEGKTIVFSLKQPYTPFISNLTLGILPKHLWQSLDSDQIPFSALNVNPIGSGPYKVTKVIRSSDGIPNKVLLTRNTSYTLGKPHIEDIQFVFFPNEKELLTALTDGVIESASGLTPTGAQSVNPTQTILTAPLTSVYGIFFNQNENEILAHKEVRKALNASIDRDFIINNILQGYASETTGPLPTKNATTSLSTATTSASDFLTKAKWKKSPEGIFELKGKTSSSTLSLSLSTANIPELVATAKKIESDWSALGAKVDVRVFEPADLNQGVIRPRKYDALLFGLVTGRNGDLYPFWHSSQRNDPGLNIALYANVKADKNLEKMRVATSTEIIAAQYALFKKELDTDTPAIFLWSPDFIYATPEKLHGVELGEITTPSDRFSGIENWYVETDTVWKIFVKKD